MTTQSIEDYIKAIFLLGSEQATVQTSALANRLDVRPASVSNMLRRLAREGLIDYEPYRGAMLTEAGQKLARRMVRRHRLIERFLTEVLNYELDEVHEEAERLEHAVSPHFVEALDTLLENPRTDPHGDPIPARDGAMNTELYPSLDEIGAGTSIIVRRLSDRDSALLRYYSELGLHPGTEAQVVDVAPHGGPLTVKVNGHRHHLSRQTAAGIFVEVVPRTPK